MVAIGYSGAMNHNRRQLLRGALGLGFVPLLARSAMAQAGSLFPFTDDKGKQVYNYRLPSDISTEGLPGILWTGAASPDVILVEFFDYNCPYCRVAAKDMQRLLETDGGLRVGFVNNPILSAGSVQVAKAQQAVLRAYGPVQAYAFHRRMFEVHGPVDGPAALKVAADLGLDSKRIEHEGDLPQVGEVIRRQAGLAKAAGFAATPSFMVDGIGILGYPGPQALARAVAEVRKCDKLVCSSG